MADRNRDAEMPSTRDALIALDTETGLDEQDAPDKKGCGCFTGGFRSFVRRRWKWLLLAFVLWGISFTLILCFLPSYIIQDRLNGAHITLNSASMVINSTTANMVRPSVKILAPEALLSLPFISYTATIHPFQATIKMSISSGVPGSPADEVTIGVMHITKELQIASGADLNMNVEGEFEITGDEYLAKVVNQFIISPDLAATMKATLDCSGLVWGWLPVYFPGISVHYTTKVAAFNNFKDNDPMLDKIITAYGEPSNLAVGCTAFINNPSPMSLVVHDAVQMRVTYDYNGINYTVGVVKSPGFTIAVGRNTVQGTLHIQQTQDNEQAIIDMVTAYMGGIQHGFSPAGTKPFLVGILDDGDATASSELLRKSMKGLDVSFQFRPAPMYFIKDITADVTIGGSLIHWPPSLYKSVVHLKVVNPLPTQARVESVFLTAYHMNLSGPVLYRFNRKLDPNKYLVPASQEVVLDFDLFLSEVGIPDSLKEIEKLAKEAVDQKITVGIHAEMNMIVDPAYRQHVSYTNNQIWGTICYHATVPKEKCGSPDVGRRLLLPSEPVLAAEVV